MKKFATIRLLAACMTFIAVCAIASYADSGLQDPTLRVFDGIGTAPPGTPHDFETSTTFKFTLPANKTGNTQRYTGHYVITNNSGRTWGNLVMREKTVPAVAITQCGDGTLFHTCEVVQKGKWTDIIFLRKAGNINSHGAGKGLADGGTLNFDFNPSINLGWPAGTVFTVSSTPEPGTMVLLGTGIVGLLSRRKKILGGS